MSTERKYCPFEGDYVPVTTGVRKPDQRCSLALAPCSAPRRPLKRDAWTRGFVCAVAKLVEMYGDGAEAIELFRLAGKLEHILKHADEEDIATLRSAGLIQQNK